jgi:hypothetical protein
MQSPRLTTQCLKANNHEMTQISKTASRLYEAAEKLRDVRGPSAVGRLLGVTPQVMKNWELREVSEGGALLAQMRIGCDANWILGHNETMPKQTRALVHEARDLSAIYQVNSSAWPFTKIRAEEWAQLDAEHKDAAERLLSIYLDGVRAPVKQSAFGT